MSVIEYLDDRAQEPMPKGYEGPMAKLKRKKKEIGKFIRDKGSFEVRGGLRPIKNENYREAKVDIWCREGEAKLVVEKWDQGFYSFQETSTRYERKDNPPRWICKDNPHFDTLKEKYYKNTLEYRALERVSKAHKRFSKKTA